MIMDGRENPLMDRKVVGVVLLERLSEWLVQPQLFDVVWCSVVQRDVLVVALTVVVAVAVFCNVVVICSCS